ncbi:hypothetical protein [Dysgonomonas sp. 25]|uniref:hypothetical protein n=1 Tax=Dysgonomonas sp. 25 TaxID=2302933 RepID=UPI0013D020D7|nr:hypothetical protein [Dysgonomonas sp. 25]NDV69979.1 hypothetical protein [Dysgonomonas sp. 25]
MKIELRNVSYNERLSEDSHCFSADLFADGKKIASCSDGGHGGMTRISPYKGCEEELRQIEEYAKSLPPVIDQHFKLEMDLELLIGQLMNDYLFENKVLKKYQNRCVVLGSDKTNPMLRYWYFSGTKKKIPITEMLQNDEGKKLLAEVIKEALSNNQTIYNTNIPEEVIKSIELELKQCE